MKEDNVFKEKERVSKLSQIREIVFGAQDGLLVPLGVISSVAGAFNNNHIVIIAGISEALAGAFSMATGSYLSSKAVNQVKKSELKKERHEIKHNIEYEKQELTLILEKEGLAHKDAELVIKYLSRSDKAFFNTMVQKELGIDPDLPDNPVTDAIYMGFSYLICATIPLIAYFFFNGMQALIISIILTFIALFIIGAIKGKLSSMSILFSGLEILLVGSFSGIGGYLLGTIMPKILGIN